MGVSNKVILTNKCFGYNLREIDICAKVKKLIPGFQNGMRSLEESPIVGEVP